MAESLSRLPLECRFTPSDTEMLPNQFQPSPRSGVVIRSRAFARIFHISWSMRLNPSRNPERLAQFHEGIVMDRNSTPRLLVLQSRFVIGPAKATDLDIESSANLGSNTDVAARFHLAHSSEADVYHQVRLQY